MPREIAKLLMTILLVPASVVSFSSAPNPEVKNSKNEQPSAKMPAIILGNTNPKQSSSYSPYGSQHPKQQHPPHDQSSFSHELQSRSVQHRLPRSQTTKSVQTDAAVLTHLLEQVGQLQATVASLTNEVAGLRVQNDDLRHNVTALEVRNSALAAELTQLSQVTTNDVGSLKILSEGLQQNLTTLHAHQVSLDVELGQSAQTISQQSTALQVVFEQFASFRRDAGQASHQQNNSLEQLNQAVSGIQTSVAGLQRHQNLTDNTLLAHTTRIDQLEPRLTSAESRTAQVEKQTESLATWRTNVTGDVSRLEMAQARLANDVLGVKEGGRQAAAVSSQLQGDLQQLSNTLAICSRAVVFYANLSDNTHWSQPPPPPPFPIIPDQALTNEGQAYNTTTGEFTVPVDGYYFFAAISVSGGHSSGSPRMELMVDDTRLFLTGLSYSSVEAALKLRAGQRVWLRSLFSSRYGRGMYFTGFLIRPTIS